MTENVFLKDICYENNIYSTVSQVFDEIIENIRQLLYKNLLRNK